MKMYWMLAAGETPAANSQPEVIEMQPAAPAAQPSTQADGSSAPAPDQTPPKQPPNVWMQILPLGLLFVLMYLMLFRAPRKKQQEHQKMVSAMKKNDRVRTIGGILGTVLDIRDDEVVLKVDENNNTKIRVIPSAIAEVINPKQ